MKETDGRDVCQCLPDCGVFTTQGAYSRSKQIQCSDGVGAKAQGDGIHGLETLRQCRLKIGVPTSVRRNIAQRDDGAGPIRVDAGTCPGLVWSTPTRWLSSLVAVDLQVAVLISQ